MTQPPHHLSDLEITASLVPGATRPRCGVPDCTACEARLDEAHAAARAFHAGSPQRLATLQRRMAKRSPVRWWQGDARRWLAAPIGAVVMAGVALALWARSHDARVADPPVAAGPVIRTKGAHTAGDDVRMFVSRAGVAHRWSPGDAVQPGDAIRFVVDPRGTRYVLVVSIDGARKISTYYPFDGEASAGLPAVAGPVELDGSIVLDETLGDERIWVLLSAEPLAAGQLRPALAQLAARGTAAVLAAPDDILIDGLVGQSGVRAVSLALHKVAPR